MSSKIVVQNAENASTAVPYPTGDEQRRGAMSPDPGTLVILECEPGKCLAKTYTDPALPPKDYDRKVWLVRPGAVTPKSVEDLARVLRELASDPSRCVIRGMLIPGALAEWVPRRKGDDYEHAPDFAPCPRSWVCVDVDSSSVAFDVRDPAASIATWRAELPEGLGAAGMVFQLAAKSHLRANLSGHAWFLLDDAIDDARLRAWYQAHGFDEALADAIQIHYTADPIFPEGVVDPLAGRRIHVYEGPRATLDLENLPKRVKARGRAAYKTRGNSGAPPAAGEYAAVLNAIGPAAEHEGRRWKLLGHLGGHARKIGWTPAMGEGLVRAWLAPIAGPLCDVDHGLERFMGAWGYASDAPLTGRKAIADLICDEKWADEICQAMSAMKESIKHVADAADADPALAFTAVPQALPGDHDQPLTLSGANNQMWVRTETGYMGPYSHKRMRVVCKALGIFELVCKISGGKKAGDLKSYEAIYDAGTHIERTVRNFAETRTWYDPDEGELHQGYELPVIEGEEDPVVAAWLSLLYGDMLPNVLNWIVACAQEHIEKPAAALVLVGPPGIGKTLIFRALARLWGARSFVPLEDSIAQFNGTITRCPIVLDDECAAIKARKVSSAVFRQRVQAEQRDYELKGKEKVELLGCTREGITANDLSEVALTDTRGAGVVEALKDRLLVVKRTLADAPAIQAALAKVRGNGSREAEVTRITKHLAWVWRTHKLPADPGRFIGAGGEDAERVATAGIAHEGAAVWDSLAKFLEGDKDGRIPETTNPELPPASAWIVHNDTLYGNASLLAQTVSMRVASWAGRHGEMQAADLLQSVASGDATRLRTSAGTRPKFYPIDLRRVRCFIE